MRFIEPFVEDDVANLTDSYRWSGKLIVSIDQITLVSSLVAVKSIWNIYANFSR
ncbi:hypothetical protein SAMN02745127_00655 [Oceanospirillum multiglobuliferum]|nr:hypothetical protein SAMN02745127_00655 [Oceanospirillum multiglobuliferum]